MPKVDDAPAATARPIQAKCANRVDGRVCNHAASFHGTRRAKCQALGCKCEQWVQPKAA